MAAKVAIRETDTATTGIEHGAQVPQKGEDHNDHEQHRKDERAFDIM